MFAFLSATEEAERGSTGGPSGQETTERSVSPGRRLLYRLRAARLRRLAFLTGVFFRKVFSALTSPLLMLSLHHFGHFQRYLANSSR